MLSPLFSVTERAIIHPVLDMRACLLYDPAAPCGFGAYLWHVVESVALARVTSLFTSIFAVADAFVHFLTGCYKGAILLLSKCCYLNPPGWSSSEVGAHFRSTAFFITMALVGSVAATIWPGVLKYFLRTPVDALEELDEADGKKTELPPNIQTLARNVCTGDISPPYEELKTFWKHSDLSSRKWFVQVFDGKGRLFQAVRGALKGMVYRSITSSYQGKEIKWLNQTEVEIQVSSAESTKKLSQAFFFHATSQKALESILKSEKVEVRHEKAFRGAFVSTKPELDFGDCVLAFRRNIERLSSLQIGFGVGESYWAGFSRNIPVTQNTLAYIILNSTSEERRKHIETQCEKLTGRKIEVVLMDKVGDRLSQVRDLQMGIPQEWPGGDDREGVRVLHAMKIAITAPQRVSLLQSFFVSWAKVKLKIKQALSALQPRQQVAKGNVISYGRSSQMALAVTYG